jgi:hypothetical protein
VSISQYDQSKPISRFLAIADIPLNHAETDANTLVPGSQPGAGDDSPMKFVGPPQERAVNKTDYKTFKEKQTRDIKCDDLFVQQLEGNDIVYGVKMVQQDLTPGGKVKTTRRFEGNQNSSMNVGEYFYSESELAGGMGSAVSSQRGSKKAKIS